MRTKTITIGSAILGFVICYSSMASSAIQSIPSQLCTSSTLEIECSITGGTWASAGVNVVYVDGYGYGYSEPPGTVLLDLIRFSYTGTRTEQAGPVQFHSGSFEVLLGSPVMSTNPSPWDYYTLLIDFTALDQNKFSLYGVGVSSN